MPQVGFEPESLSGNLLEFDHDTLNCSANMAGYVLTVTTVYERHSTTIPMSVLRLGIHQDSRSKIENNL